MKTGSRINQFQGVDFPAVDWVVQVDCPDSVDSYIHRVGRTARYESRLASLRCFASAGVLGPWPLRHGQIGLVSVALRAEFRAETLKGRFAEHCVGDCRKNMKETYRAQS